MNKPLRAVGSGRLPAHAQARSLALPEKSLRRAAAGEAVGGLSPHVPRARELDAPRALTEPTAG